MVDQGSRVEDRASQTATASREQAANVAQTAREQTRDVARQAQEQARSAVQQMAHDAKGRADEEASKLARSLHATSDQLRGMADATPEPGFAGNLVREGASAAERLATHLEQGGIDGALADVRSFARRSPGVFLFGSAVAGFVAGRLVRNMSADQLRDAMQFDTRSEPADGEPLVDLRTTDATVDFEPGTF